LPQNACAVSVSAKFLDFARGFVYYGNSKQQKTREHIINSKEEYIVIKVNQEELQEKIKKLKQASAEKAAKAAGKKSEPEARKALKKVKRAQRKLRTAKAYKSAGKKAAEAKPASA